MKYALAAVLAAVTLSGEIRTTTYRGRPAVANQVIVRIQAGGALPPGDLVPLSASSGLYLLRSPRKSVADLVAEARGFTVEPDYIVHTQDLATVPLESQYALLWGLSRIGAPAAWNISTGSPSVSAAVIDSGIDYTHPDLAASIWSAPAEYTVWFGNTPVTCPAGSHGFNAINLSCDPMDDNGHGTHVSGTLGAAGTGLRGLVGVTQSSPLVGIKFVNQYGNGALSDAIRGIDFALQLNRIFPRMNLRVLSASWGSFQYSQLLEDMIAQAGNNNILFVTAAGNSALNIDYGVNRFYPASYPLANIIPVTAADEKDGIAGFANFGPKTVTVSAPGVRILSTYLNGGYATGSGTSMATPHVAGAAILIFAACPWLGVRDAKQLIYSTADTMSPESSFMITGGRLNVNAAVRACPGFVAVP